MSLPRYSCKIGQDKEGYELGAYRDGIGNVSFLFWKSGLGFKKEQEVLCRIDDLKKLRKWIDKIIQHLERP